MKIGFVLDDSLDKADGVQQYVLSLGEWLKRSHDVHYLVSTSRRTDVTNVHSLARNMAVRFNGNRMSMPLPASLRAIRQLLVRESFDVLHVQMPYSPLFAQRVILAAPKQTAVIGTFHIVPHGRHVSLASRGLAVWTAPSLKRFDAVVSVSEAAQAFARQTFKLETTVLPNVVDVQRFARAKPFAKAAATTIVFLGRLVPRKGCQILLEAINLLMQDPATPPIKVIICGRGPLEADLKIYVRDHMLADQVEFTGFITEADKPRYLRSADIAVFPSIGGESFGIVLLEAMAAGALTLGADNSGYHSVLQAKPELLFKIKDPAALAAKLAEYIEQPRRRQADAAWGQDYVQAFDTAVVGQQLLTIYADALHQRQNVQ